VAGCYQAWNGPADAYATFDDISSIKPHDGYKKICVNFIFDVKHDGHHKA